MKEGSPEGTYSEERRLTPEPAAQQAKVGKALKWRMIGKRVMGSQKERRGKRARKKRRPSFARSPPEPKMATQRGPREEGWQGGRNKLEAFLWCVKALLLQNGTATRCSGHLLGSFGEEVKEKVRSGLPGGSEKRSILAAGKSQESEGKKVFQYLSSDAQGEKNILQGKNLSDQALSLGLEQTANGKRFLKGNSLTTPPPKGQGGRLLPHVEKKGEVRRPSGSSRRSMKKKKT